MSDRFSSASTQICPVEVPVFLANAETPPALLNGIYKALFHDRHDVIAAPVEYDFLRSTPAEALQAIDGRLNSGESPLMMFEWQWEQPMLEVLSLVSRKRQPALFIKPGSGERVKRVQVLIGGGHRSIENLKMAWKIAQHLKASIVAIRVIDPAWVRYDERLGRVEYSFRYQSIMQNYLKKIGLPIPVQVVHEANAIDRLIHQARPTDLLVLGIPNDFVIQHSFGDSHAGQALRHSAGPVVAVSRGSGDDAVSLNSTLWEATVLCDLQAGSKWQAMEEMVEALVDAGQIPYSKRNLVLEDLFKRESELSTYVGNGVAVPHAALDDCVDPIVCLAVSRNGIPYDEEPANFIFMLISSRQDHVKYLKMQAGIARFMKRSALERREQMLDCNSAAEVVQVLRAELQPEERGIGYIF